MRFVGIQFSARMPEGSPTSAELALEQSGLEFLRNGKFRKARDAFKSLNKSQPSRALPLLIEANLGLANEMMSKGLVSEAKQVLAYLKTIAPATCDLTLGPVGKKAPDDAWAAMVPLAAMRLDAASDPDVRIRAADEMILGADSAEHAIHPDAKAILSALELGYGSATADQTAPLLRSIPRASPFSHWVFFFKGMAALEAGDHTRAADCFRRVPANSLLQASIPALLSICNAPPHPEPTSRTVHALCAWAGHPALAEPLLQAEPLWRKQRTAKAFTLLTNKIPNLMCWGARSFKSDLARFLTTEFVHGHLNGSDYIEGMLDYVSAKSRSVASAILDQAFFAITFAEFSGCAHSHLKAAVANMDHISRVASVSPAMRSRIFTRLAESYIDSVKNDPDDLCSGPAARKALGHAIRHDPDNLHAWLTQCDLLAMGKDRSAYHRFVDDLAKRFPAEKEVLIRNGDCCIGRSSHTKALRNFENAAKIDAVDPRITRGMLRAHLGIAEEAYKKRRFSKVNWELIHSLASGNKSCPEFSPWRLRVCQLVFEARCGAESKLAGLAAEAMSLAPSPFLFEAACRIGLSKYKAKFKEGVLEMMLPSRPAPQSLADFLAVIDEVELIDDDDSYAYAANAVRRIFTEHQALLLDFVRVRKDLTTLLTKILSTREPDIGLASPVIQKWHAADPSDTVLLYLCISYRFPWLPVRPEVDFSDVAEDFRALQDPDDQRLLKLFDRDRQRVANANFGGGQAKSPKLDLDYDPHENEDEDYDEDDGDMEETLAALDQAAGKMKPSKLIATLAKILEGSPYAGAIDPVPYTPPRPKAPGIPAKKTITPDPAQLSFDALIPPPPQP